MAFKVAPITGSFMIMSILGFIISTLYVYPRTASYGVSFSIVFSLMFIASMISMSYADVDEILYLEKKAREEGR